MSLHDLLLQDLEGLDDDESEDELDTFGDGDGSSSTGKLDSSVMDEGNDAKKGGDDDDSDDDDDDDNNEDTDDVDVDGGGEDVFVGWDVLQESLNDSCMTPTTPTSTCSGAQWGSLDVLDSIPENVYVELLRKHNGNRRASEFSSTTRNSKKSNALAQLTISFFDFVSSL
eukprot:m.79889 g.79889  ORF g.79889 m.79889 type:complete len:170 (-) comp8615_c9_seq2:346-855(-)